ncbi:MULTISPECIES: phosphoribosylglycinamide formyltransferase [unclassified Rothia (in: high G+C Gram-positive bacteria)]|uniref:phosphoribosylglycinamide formyltransferase n=1 Tax=unclassified Rothia (in: high G+C Gram-positive bacteria) TaxID=2689056 RepID=UPI00195D56DF|nr:MULTISPECIES: phosphoribosylglycinamide formyltransferase [unclassified Rothia (in: high G+C Gram-positive bacteria)]MBM7051478.1 phosphoribosylglycinamide formyltransferase [Rothia sp. ZJ1223]QRZ61266.1 phosphoribosylglycinamide formyltransferase [Rothia sp. ZJ932]
MRIVVMVSGSGTNLQSMMDAVQAGTLNVEIVAVGADKPCTGIDRAANSGIETFLVEPSQYETREQWNRALEEQIASYAPDYIVFAGFMRIVDAQLVQHFEQRIINTHPALLPSFPGAHGVRDALAHGVKITGLTVHFVDSGVDTGSILAQAAVAVHNDDTEETLHERIKVQERKLLVETINTLATA